MPDTMVLGAGLIALVAVAVAVVALMVARRERRASQRTSAQFSALMDATGFGVLIVQAGGRISYANDTASELLGYSPAQLVGADKHELLHGDAVEEPGQECPLRAALQQRRPHFGRDHFRRADGSALPITVSTAPIPGDPGAALVFRDRSAEVVEEQRREEGFALISHEIRSPLTTIVGFSNRLQRAVQTGRLDVSEQHGEEIALLAQEAVRMRDIVTVVLDAATLERAIEVEAEPVAMRHLVREETERICRAAPGADFVIEGEGPTIESDERYVRRILHNLLENAVKYGGVGQPIEVRLGEADGGCSVAVRDHGPGIPVESQPQIFTRFYRQERTAGRRPGLGLGLYLSRRLARQLGGTLTFTSEPGAGAEFTLWLPAAPPAEPPTRQASTSFRW